MSGRKRYPLRTARTAHGIRAQDLRSTGRKSWWSRRWIEVLEAMHLGARLGRAKQYALDGQVTELELIGSHVEARVMGSRPEAYRVSLDFTAVTPEGKAIRKISQEPMLLGRLFTDDLPTEIEEILRKDKVALFPELKPIGTDERGKAKYDVTMKCNCPDWMRPCKHLIAVMLLLGEEISRHPSTLLALRGVDIEDIVPPLVGRVAPRPPPPPLGQELLLAAASEPAPLLKRLGPIPFWRGERRCQEALSRIYTRVRPTALDAAQGHSIDLRP